jgi:hypothetical protein
LAKQQRGQGIFRKVSRKSAQVAASEIPRFLPRVVCAIVPRPSSRRTDAGGFRWLAKLYSYSC